MNGRLADPAAGSDDDMSDASDVIPIEPPSRGVASDHIDGGAALTLAFIIILPFHHFP